MVIITIANPILSAQLWGRHSLENRGSCSRKQEWLGPCPLL